MHVDDHIIVQN